MNHLILAETQFFAMINGKDNVSILFSALTRMFPKPTFAP